MTEPILIYSSRLVHEKVISHVHKPKSHAIAFYTDAIDQNCNLPKLNSICYSNRAAVNLKLGIQYFIKENYGKVIKDCLKAIEFDPENTKAYYRAAKALTP